MDVQQLVEVLQGTIHPDTREMAEKQLNEVHYFCVIMFFAAKTWRIETWVFFLWFCFVF